MLHVISIFVADFVSATEEKSEMNENTIQSDGYY